MVSEPLDTDAIRNWPQINPEVLEALIAENADLRVKLAEVESELSEERDHAEEGWERARHLLVALNNILEGGDRG